MLFFLFPICMKLFLTYGDNSFIKSRERIRQEAENLNYFDKIIVETDKIRKEEGIINCLEDPNFKEVFNSGRGGGYWMWKPYIICKHLQSLNENDILIYTDCGSTLPNNEYTTDKLDEFINILKNSEKGMVVFPCECPERQYTKGDVFKHFGCEDDEKFYNSQQIEANRLIIKKNKHSLFIIEKWWSIAKNHPHLVDDSKSSIPNAFDFQDNRHDQSIFSMTCKKYDSGVEKYLKWGAVPIKLTRIRH